MLSVMEGITAFPAWLVGSAVGLALSVAGATLGIVVQTRASRQGKRSPEAVAGIVFGLLLGLVALSEVAVALMFYGPLDDYARCMRSAITITVQNDCQIRYLDKVTPGAAGAPRPPSAGQHPGSGSGSAALPAWASRPTVSAISSMPPSAPSEAFSTWSAGNSTRWEASSAAASGSSGGRSA
jgi:hypothetical protein